MVWVSGFSGYGRENVSFSSEFYLPESKFECWRSLNDSCNIFSWFDDESVVKSCCGEGVESIDLDVPLGVVLLPFL